MLHAIGRTASEELKQWPFLFLRFFKGGETKERKTNVKVNESAGETHLRLCEKQQQLPADVLFGPDGHKKGSK